MEQERVEASLRQEQSEKRTADAAKKAQNLMINRNATGRAGLRINRTNPFASVSEATTGVNVTPL
jgi:hypothetical protein